MKYLFIFASLCALAHSVIALIQKDYANALGLFGGFGAWILVTAHAWNIFDS